jgi:hypothetical protein
VWKSTGVGTDELTGCRFPGKARGKGRCVQLEEDIIGLHLHHKYVIFAHICTIVEIIK